MGKKYPAMVMAKLHVILINEKQERDENVEQSAERHGVGKAKTDGQCDG